MAGSLVSVLFPGVVRLTSSSDTLRPSWFKNVELGESDDVALQQAVDSCHGTCILMLHGPAFINKVCSCTCKDDSATDRWGGCGGACLGRLHAPDRQPGLVLLLVKEWLQQAADRCRTACTVLLCTMRA